MAWWHCLNSEDTGSSPQKEKVQINRHELSLTHQGNIRICMKVISHPGVRVQERTSLSFPLERPASWLMTGWRRRESKSTKGWGSWAVLDSQTSSIVVFLRVWYNRPKRGCLLKTQFQGPIRDLYNQISGVVLAFLLTFENYSPRMGVGSGDGGGVGIGIEVSFFWLWIHYIWHHFVLGTIKKNPHFLR